MVFPWIKNCDGCKPAIFIIIILFINHVNVNVLDLFESWSVLDTMRISHYDSVCQNAQLTVVSYHFKKTLDITKKPLNFEWFFCLETGIDLSSRAVSSQVLLAQVSLTSVFGMGTGGTSPLQTPVMVEY